LYYITLLKKISESVDLIDGSSEIEGAVLCSSVANVFTAGLDLQEFYQPNRKALHEYWVLAQQTTAKLYGMRKPLAVEIEDTAILAGCMLALVGDHRIMRDSSDAVIGLNETLYNFACPPWLCQLLIDTIGRKHAEKALIEGLVFTPKDALVFKLILSNLKSYFGTNIYIKQRLLLFSGHRFD